MNISQTFTRASLLAALFSGAIAVSAPALAAADDTPPQAAFSIRGVDFTSPRAVAHLKHRLGRTATGICMRDLQDHLIMTADERMCYATAFADGQAQISSRQQQAIRDQAIRLADARGDGHPAH